MSNEFPFTKTKMNKIRNVFNKKHGSTIRTYEDNAYIIKYRVRMSIPVKSGWNEPWLIFKYDNRCIIEVVECHSKRMGGRLSTINKHTDMWRKNRVMWSCNYQIQQTYTSLVKLYGVTLYSFKMSYKFP